MVPVPAAKTGRVSVSDVKVGDVVAALVDFQTPPPVVPA